MRRFWTPLKLVKTCLQLLKKGNMRRLYKLFSSPLDRIGHVPSRLKTGRPPAPLGARILTNHDDIFQHNMWDHVQWTPEEMEQARQKAEENSCELIPLEKQVMYERDANKHWDRFYERHHNKFFKNRQWLFTEFPELSPRDLETSCAPDSQQHGVTLCSGLKETHHSSMEHLQEKTHTNNYSVITELPNNNDSVEKPLDDEAFPGQHASFRILEVGCGVGNSVFPIINSIRRTDAFLYCLDFSSRAIQLVKEHPDYDPALCNAFVQDICNVSQFPFPCGSLDIILMVFVLSSIHPERMQGVLNRLAGYLKHGGIMLFRDYGRYDLAQLRFKKGQCLRENFYTRQDGTCVYFFTKEEVHQLFTNAGLEEIQNLEDKRIQVNRGKKVVMHRVWMQGKYRKP